MKFFTIGVIFLLTSVAFGAEVRNLSSYQDGDVVIVGYDLLGDSGEKTAEEP